ncbi:virulence-associated E family protein [Rhizobium bangladeshense]|uniref:virulence-associated E family protein n=1 Tax=Rhizobium bangladeshense TaxID=1138189 RepID=UPI0007E55CB4|nr:virulence-associated E family protein [Rhizobium bangladeshense]
MADEVGKNVVSLDHWEKLRLKQAKDRAVPIKAIDADELTRIKNPSGIVPDLGNAKRAILKLGLTFRFDVFRQKIVIEGYDQPLGETLDDIELKVRDVVLETLGFDPESKFTREAIRLLAIGNSFDPVRDYLDGLKWDGVPRLDTWLRDYLGAEDDELTSAIGRAVLTAGVRRVRKPGCKFDGVLVLEGRQGSGKSTALKILAGGETFFSDEIVIGESYKEQQELLRGRWIVELPELAGLNNSEVRRVKQFISKTVDRARGAFQRSVEELPRRCLMVATTNDAQYLKDTTGNRRFWIVVTGKIDLAGLTEVRDQLWAEAAAAELSAPDPITLPESLWGEAAKRAAERVASDPWEDLLAAELPDVAKEVEGELRVTTQAVFERVLKMDVRMAARRDTLRLAECMRALGWYGPKVLWADGVAVRGYAKQAGMAPPTLL